MNGSLAGCLDVDLAKCRDTKNPPTRDASAGRHNGMHTKDNELGTFIVSVVPNSSCPLCPLVCVLCVPFSISVGWTKRKLLHQIKLKAPC